MPSVIDALVVTLGLDPKDFVKGTKATSDNVNQLKKETDKAAKEIERSGKQAAAFFGEIKNQALAMASVFLGGLGIKEFVSQTVTADAATGRLASNLGISSSELSKWGVAARIAGGSTEGIESAFKSFSSAVQTLSVQGRIEGPLQFFAGLGIALNDAQGNVRPVTELLKDVSGILQSAKSPAEASKIGELLGLDERTIYFLRQGTTAVDGYLKEADRIGHVTEQNSAAALELSQNWDKMILSSQTLGRTLLTDLAPALNKVLVGMTSMSVKLKEDNFDNPINRFFSGIVDKLGGTKGWSLGSELFEVLNPGAGSGGGAASIPMSGAPSQQAPSAPSANTAIPRSLRNNNPGNLEYTAYTRSLGATGSDGRFAIFPSLEAGQQASIANLQRLRRKGNDTISKLVGVWSPAGENGAANTNSYIGRVAKQTGIDANAAISDADLPNIANAMFAHEAGNSPYARQVLQGASSRAGSAGGSGSVNIGTITVNTQATDANGIARDMRSAINANSLVAQANSGTR